MPTYEYECRACGKREEHFQSMKDAALTKCAACGKDELERIIAPTGFVLKGGGWYKDGYGSGGGGSKGD